MASDVTSAYSGHLPLITVIVDKNYKYPFEENNCNKQLTTRVIFESNQKNLVLEPSSSYQTHPHKCSLCATNGCVQLIQQL